MTVEKDNQFDLSETTTIKCQAFVHTGTGKKVKCVGNGRKTDDAEKKPDEDL